MAFTTIPYNEKREKHENTITTFAHEVANLDPAYDAMTLK